MLIKNSYFIGFCEPLSLINAIKMHISVLTSTAPNQILCGAGGELRILRKFLFILKQRRTSPRVFQLNCARLVSTEPRSRRAQSFSLSRSRLGTENLHFCGVAACLETPLAELHSFLRISNL